MIGFAFMHGPLSIPCIAAVVYLIVFSIRTVIQLLKRINTSRKVFVQFGVTIFILALAFAPYQYLQILMLDRYGLPKDAKGFFAQKSVEGDVEMMKRLLDKGLEPDKFLFTGLLKNACFHEDIAVIEFLLDKGADVNKRDGIFKESPLMVAAENGRVKAVKTLLKHGADPHITNKYGKTALDIANQYKQTGVVAILSKYK